MFSEESLPKFDLPTDFVVGDFITKEMLDFYKFYPCKIKAGVFVLLTEGKIRATINLSEYNIKPYDFVTVAPGSFIQIHDIEGKIKLHFVGFSSSFIENSNHIKSYLEFLPLLAENPVIPLPEEPALLCRDFMSVVIRTDFYDNDFLGADDHRQILHFFLNQISKFSNSRNNWNQDLTRDNIIVKDFVQSVMRNYVNEHSVSFYAKESGVTLQHFCNTIKKVTGKTALEIISGVIIMDAKAQLKSTDLAIKDIAASLGFTNHAFFNKYFKQHVGMTPQEYRKN